MNAPTDPQYLGPQRIPLLKVSGDAHARGLQRGRALQALVVSRVERAIAELAAAASWATSLSITERFERVLRERDPEVLDTLRGVADGAGIPWADYRVAVMGAGGWFRLDCSVFAATGPATVDGELIMAKNGDLDPPFMTDDDVFAMESVPEQGYRFIEMGVYPERAYQPDGMNECGLTVVGCGQKASDGHHAWRQGLGIGITVYDIMHRIYARCATIEDALEVLRESPRGYSGRTLILGDASGRWVKAEVTYGHLSVFEPEPDRAFPANFVCAGVSGTLSSPELRPLITSIEERPSSYLRYDRYMDLLYRNAGAVDFDFAQRLLRDTHPEPGENSICKHAGHPTLESFIFLPQQRRVWAVKGLPDRNEYVEIPFVAGRASLPA